MTKEVQEALRGSDDQDASAVPFTSGPWRVEQHTALVWGECTIHEDGTPNRLGFPVADCELYQRQWARPLRDGERVANAHLVAAAPELYEALRQISALKIVTNSDTNARTIWLAVGLAVEALAKATALAPQGTSKES